jgi:hypothetical protein
LFTPALSNAVSSKGSVNIFLIDEEVDGKDTDRTEPPRVGSPANQGRVLSLDALGIRNLLSSNQGGKDHNYNLKR